MKIAILVFEEPSVHIMDVMDGLVEDDEIESFLSEQGYDPDNIRWVAGDDIPVKNIEFPVAPEVRLAKTIQDNGTAISGGYKIHFRGYKLDVSFEDGPRTIVVTDAEAGESVKESVELTASYADDPERDSFSLQASKLSSEQLNSITVHILMCCFKN